jgi:hypothetical protein
MIKDLSDQKRASLLDRWLDLALEGYPSGSSGLLGREKDPISNPVGHALSEGGRAILSMVLDETPAEGAEKSLEELMKVRSVQAFTASQAVAPVFLMRRVLAEEAGGERAGLEDLRELLALEGRFEKVAFFAFDAYARCRERVSEARVNEMRRQIYLIERTHPFFADARPETGPEGEPDMQRETKRGDGP